MYERYMKTTPYEWEFELTDRLLEHWSSIMKTGAPADGWLKMNSNYETLFVYETNSAMKSGLEVKMMDFWLNQWSPDWKP